MALTDPNPSSQISAAGVQQEQAFDKSTISTGTRVAIVIPTSNSIPKKIQIRL